MTFDFTELMHDLDIELPEDTTRVALELTYQYDEWQNITNLWIDFYAIEDDCTTLVYSDSYCRKGAWKVYDILEDWGFEELCDFVAQTKGIYDKELDNTFYTDPELK